MTTMTPEQFMAWLGDGSTPPKFNSQEEYFQYLNAPNTDVTGFGKNIADDFNQQISAYEGITPVQKFKAYERYKNDWQNIYKQKGYTDDQIGKIFAEADTLADPRNQEGFFDQAYGLGQQFLAGWEKAAGNFQAAFNPEWAEDNLKAAEEHRAKSGANAQISTYLQQREQQEREQNGQSGFGATVASYWNNPRAFVGGFTEEVLPQLAMAAPAIAATPFTGGTSLAPVAAAVLGTQGALSEAGAYRLAMKDKIEGMSQAQLMALPEMQSRMAQGMTFEQAKADFATDFSDHGVGTAAAAGIGSLESLSGIGKLGVAKGLKGAVKTFTKEPVLQGGQEGFAQVNQNLGAMQIDPNQTLTEGVGSSVATGGLFGVPTGAVSAISQLRSPAESESPEQQSKKVADEIATPEQPQGATSAEKSAKSGNAVDEHALENVLADYKTQVDEAQYKKMFDELKGDIEDGLLAERANSPTEYGKLAQAYLQGVNSEQNSAKNEPITPEEVASEARVSNYGNAQVKPKSSALNVEQHSAVEQYQKATADLQHYEQDFDKRHSSLPEEVKTLTKAQDPIYQHLEQQKQQAYDKLQASGVKSFGEDVYQPIKQANQSLAKTESVSPTVNFDTEIRLPNQPKEFSMLQWQAMQQYQKDLQNFHQLKDQASVEFNEKQNKQAFKNPALIKARDTSFASLRAMKETGVTTGQFIKYLPHLEKSNGTEFNADDLRYSLNESANSEFAKAVDVVANGGSVAGYINVGTTPDVLRMLGLPDVKVTIHGNTFNKVMQDKHNITAQTLKQLPTQINNPVAIMKSATQENGYVVLTELVEYENGKNKPVIAALHLKQDANGLELINIASVYGRSNAQIQRGLENDLLYWNNKKGADFVNTFGLQLPSYALKNQPSASNIKTETDLSQYQRSQSTPQSNTDPEIEQAKTLLRGILGDALVEQIQFTNSQNITDPNPKLQADKRSSEGFVEKGKLTLVVDNITAGTVLNRSQRLAWVAWHELAHAGIEVKYGSAFQTALNFARSNPVVRVIGDRIAKSYANDGITLTENQATEEAIVELYAATQTENWAEIEQRYGLKLHHSWKRGEKSVLNHLARIAYRLRNFIRTITGAEVKTASDQDVLNVLRKVKLSVNELGKKAQSKANDDVRYSLNENADSEFEKAVDDFIEGNSVKTSISMGTTPDVLKMIGLPDVEVKIQRKTLGKIMHGKHAIEPETLKQLPKQLNNPVGVFKSAPHSSNPDGYVVLTELVEFNADNNRDEPVIAALHLDKTGEVQLIEVASAYGKNHQGLQNILNKDKVYYWNKEKGSQLVNVHWLQLPLKLRSEANLSEADIKTETDLSQYQAENSSNEPDIRYSFAGKKARTADYSLLEQAKSEVERGQDPETVRQQTGWFKGVDGKWRFEIDDSPISLTRDWHSSVTAEGAIRALGFAKGNGSVTLSDILNAPALFNAYPDLATMSVGYENGVEYSGAYFPEQNRIVLNATMPISQVKSILLHEIQHAIQEREGFAKGGNTHSFSEQELLDLSPKEVREAKSVMANIQQTHPEFVRDYHAMHLAIEEWFNYSGGDAEQETVLGKKANELEAKVRANPLFEAYHQAEYVLKNRKVMTQSEAYHRLSGEVEARNVQSRMAMSKDDRRRFSPEYTQDTSNTDHIMHYGEGRMDSLNENAGLSEQAYNQAKAEGKTELTFPQWKQVRSPEFKAWFGDWENDPQNASKVVNPKTGEPLVVYHGTDADFTAFDKEKQKNHRNQYGGGGFYFTEDLNVASLFGEKAMPVFLNARVGVQEKILARRKGESIEADHLRPADNRDMWIVYNPNQIKSATDNNGSFDAGNDDIRFSRRPKAESLEKLRNAETIRISGKDIEPSSDLREYKRNALNYGKTLRGTYVNKDTGRAIELGAGGVKEVLQHDYKNPDHLQSIAAIPQIIENAVYIDTLPNEETDKNFAIDEYEYYLAGLNIGGTDYTVKAVVGLSKDGDRYYDHKLTEIEKGELLSLPSRITNPVGESSSPFNEIDDKRLLQILQDENSSNEPDIRYSRKQSALDLAKTGKAEAEPTLFDTVARGEMWKAVQKVAGKVDELVADGLRPVNDWIAQSLVEHGISEHEGARLRNEMYGAKGVRDALNSDLEQAYLKPLLQKIAGLSKTLRKKDKRYDERSVKRLVGLWASTRYAIERNQHYLDREYQAMLDAKAELDNALQNGTPDDIDAADAVYRRAEKQYRYRKQDVESRDFSKDRKYKVGTAGGWSTPLAREIMHNIEQHIPRADLESVAEILYDLNQKRLEIDRDHGRYTQDQYDEYKKDRHYVPLTGDPRAEEGFDFIAGAGSNAVNIGKDKAATGRTSSEAEDAIDAVWQAVGKTTTFAGWQGFKDELDSIYESEFNRLQQAGMSIKDAKKEIQETLGISKQKMQGLTRSSDDVLIRKHGNSYYEYRIPDKAMNALKKDNVEQANGFLKLLSKPTSWYARGVTQWTITFAPMNMLRDTWEKSEFIRVQKLFDQNGNVVDAKTMDKIGRGVLKNAFYNKGTWRAVKRFGLGQPLRDSVASEKMLKELLANGGVSTYSTYLARTEKDLIKQLEAENRPIWKLLDRAGSVLESYNKVFDTVSALAAYTALIENGVDAKQAAATTLELTNFRKTGSIMQGIKALYMFSQPTAMGARNLVKYLSTPKGRHRFFGYMAVMIPLYTALRAMDEEDEGGNLMDQLGDITRYIPFPIGDGKYFKFPVGFGMPQMAWNFSVNIVKAGAGDISISEAGVNMFTHSLKTVAPISPSEISAAKLPLAKAAMTVTPTILQPLAQIVLGRTAFGSKLITNYVSDDKLKAEQSKHTTAQFYKDIALEMNDLLGIDMHPEEIKNLFDGYGSMLGSLKELQTIFVENPNRERLGRRERVPFLNQFIGTTNEFAIQSRYYEASDEAKAFATRYASQKERGVAAPLSNYERQVLAFHRASEARMKSLNTEKAKQTKALREGKISAEGYDLWLQRHNKNVDNAQRVFLKRWREMHGLNTH